MVAWIVLVVMIFSYGVNNFLAAIAASRTDKNKQLDPRLLWRLVNDKTYLAGMGFQALGTVTAFIARKDLPLFLVQAAVGTGIVVTAGLGIIVLGWKLPRIEILLIIVVLLGMTALIIAADPGPPKQISFGLKMALGALVFLYAAIGHFAARLQGARGAVALGVLAGAAFGTSAIVSRPLVNSSSMMDFLTDPLLYVFLVHTLAGQLFFGMALQHGATIAASSVQNAMVAIPPAVIGLLVLGDHIRQGMQPLALIGFAVTVTATIALAWYAQPQSHVRQKATVQVGV